MGAEAEREGEWTEIYIRKRWDVCRERHRRNDHEDMGA